MHFRIPSLVLLGLLLATGRAAAQSWVDLTPASGSPPPRRLASAVLDTQENRMVIFGGEFGSAPVVRLNDVWAFDLDTHTWENLTPVIGDAPAERRTPVSVYDPVGHRMLTWSGQGSGFFNDSWSFDLTTKIWTELAPAGGPPVSRYGAAGVWDPTTGELVTFAGFTSEFQRFDDVWRLDQDAATWTDVSSSPAPLERCLHSASYDAQEHRMIMYGGQNAGARDDIWALDLTTNTWSDLTPDTKPAGRWHTSHVYDTTTHRSTVSCGNLGGGMRTNEAWIFDHTFGIWAQLAPGGTPPTPREGAPAVYDAAGDRMVIFGGTDGSDRNDVWALVGLSSVATGIGDPAPIPRTTLHQNHPNPFNPETSIDFEIATAGHTTLRIYAMNGRLERTLIDGARREGLHTTRWDGRRDDGARVASGVYVYRLEHGGDELSRRLVLLK